MGQLPLLRRNLLPTWDSPTRLVNGLPRFGSNWSAWNNEFAEFAKAWHAAWLSFHDVDFHPIKGGEGRRWTECETQNLNISIILNVSEPSKPFRLDVTGLSSSFFPCQRKRPLSLTWKRSIGSYWFNMVRSWLMTSKSFSCTQPCALMPCRILSALKTEPIKAKPRRMMPTLVREVSD